MIELIQKMGERKMNGLKVYKINVGCVNCLNIYSVDVEYGKLAGHILPNLECRFCGNKMVLTQIKAEDKQ